MQHYRADSVNRKESVDGYSDRRQADFKKAASLWKFGMGGTAHRRRFPVKMCRMRTSDHDSAQTGGKKCKRDKEKDADNLLKS